MLLNSKKTKDMWISFCKNSIEPDLLRRNDSCLQRVSKFELLGVRQQDNLCWSYHVEQTVKKASKRLYFLRKCKKAHLPTEIGITIYCNKKRPLLEYASPQWGGLPITEVPCRRVTVYTKQVPRYHRDTTNIPSNARGQVQRSDKALIRKNCKWY